MATTTSNSTGRNSRRGRNALVTDPTTGSVTTDTGAPAGYTAVQVPAKGSGGGSSGGGGAYSSSQPQYIANPMSGQRGTGPQGGAQNPWIENPAYTAGGGAGGSGGTVWALKDANGKIYYSGDPLTVTSQYDTGQKTGGFDDAFYNKYKQKVLDYYNPQEAKQYAEASGMRPMPSMTGGCLLPAPRPSGWAARLPGRPRQSRYCLNANTQTGTLQDQIQSNKESLISQLYATEDPTLTANLAQSSANASSLKDPTLTPAAAYFSPVISGVSSALSGLGYGSIYGQNNSNQTSGGSVANANQSRGVLRS